MGKGYAKRGAEQHNPLDSGFPREHLILVGSPSNTFNGYLVLNAARDAWVGSPHPRNVAGVTRYVKGAPGNPAITHDRYWANFLEPAERLVTTGIVQPRPGDIVTIMVFLQGYLWRQAVDWNASPYNLARHQYSPWVRGKPEFDPYASGGARPPAAPQTNEFGGPARKAPRDVVVRAEDPDHVLNHHILMQTTSANSGDVVKRPAGAGDYQERLQKVPWRILFGPSMAGPAAFPDVLVKLLLVNDLASIESYVASGAFSGERWISPLEKPDEASMGAGARIDDTGSFHAHVLACSSPAWKKRWAKLMATHARPPGVKRDKIKIQRFDYVGHSAADCLILQYGWTNDKGENPLDEKFAPDLVIASEGDIWPAAGRKALAGDATAWLWGCNLGQSYARALTAYFPTVTAAEVETDFEGILGSSSAMPVPRDGQPWKTYDKSSLPPAPEWQRWNEGR